MASESSGVAALASSAEAPTCAAADAASLAPIARPGRLLTRQKRCRELQAGSADCVAEVLPQRAIRATVALQKKDYLRPPNRPCTAQRASHHHCSGALAMFCASCSSLALAIPTGARSIFVRVTASPTAALSKLTAKVNQEGLERMQKARKVRSVLGRRASAAA